MFSRWGWRGYAAAVAIAVAGAVLLGCGRSAPIYLHVVIPTRQMSKVPFIVALDQGLYKKHGLNVELRLPNVRQGINTTPALWKRALRKITGPPDIDIWIDGHTPNMVLHTIGGKAPFWVSLAATDCSMHYLVVARPGIASLNDLHGRRLGLNHFESTSGATGFRLLQKMGWVRDKDITVVYPAEMKELEAGKVDAIVSSDERLERARVTNLTVLLDTREWHDSVSGNSVLVAPGWLDDPVHREGARRFLKATVEAVALFRERKDLVLDVLARWNGVTDRAVANARYDDATFVPRVPAPCLDGMRATMELYDSPEMRKHAITDFYDDSLMREIEQSGFVDQTYAALGR